MFRITASGIERLIYLEDKKERISNWLLVFYGRTRENLAGNKLFLGSVHNGSNNASFESVIQYKIAHI